MNIWIIAAIAYAICAAIVLVVMVAAEVATTEKPDLGGVVVPVLIWPLVLLIWFGVALGNAAKRERAEP